MRSAAFGSCCLAYRTGPDRTGPTVDCDDKFWLKLRIVTFNADGRVDGSGEANVNINWCFNWECLSRTNYITVCVS
jgi:hypothetical protein